MKLSFNTVYELAKHGDPAAIRARWAWAKLNERKIDPTTGWSLPPNHWEGIQCTYKDGQFHLVRV